MTINTITQKDLDKLILYASVIVKNEAYAKDLVQEFILKQLEKGNGNMEINSGYTFKGLKLLFLEDLYIANADFRKRFIKEYEYFKSLEEDISKEEILEREKETQSKLKLLNEVYDTLNSFDKKLYTIHYIKGISKRQISRETGIKLSVIQYRFSLIKKKILKNHKNKNT